MMIGEAPDYHIYMMDRNEKAAAFFIGLAAGVAVVYIFFRSLPAGLAAGIIAGIKIQPFFRQYLLEKRKQELLLQFRDLLETLTASYSAGSNTREAFQDAIGDMSDIYGENIFSINIAHIPYRILECLSRIGTRRIGCRQSFQ